MIVLDANILIYAYDVASAHHTKARACLERLFSESPLIGLPWQSVAAFLRVTTNPRLARPKSITEVMGIIDSWLEQPNVRLLSPGDDHWLFFREVLRDGQASGPLISDAQLAALTIENGATLCTTDRDFTRFPGLKWTNPLV